MSSTSPEPIPHRPTPGSIGDIALDYQARWGLHIFPGEPEFKEPIKYGWGLQLFQQAMAGSRISPEVLSQFWESYPLANILMYPGALSGVDVIDVDDKPGKKSGFETLEELGLTWAIEEGRAASTPTGNGIHLYFKHTDDWGPNKKPPGTGLEVFWAGNQFIPMPPSMFRNPKTGEQVPIAPRRVLVFRPSHVLKEKVNQNLTGSRASTSIGEDY